MCHGSIDPKILMRDAETRYRTAAAERPATEPSGTLPPELMGGWRGVWARIAHLLVKIPAVHPAK